MPRRKKPKSFFVTSALRDDSSPLGKLQRHDSEQQALDHAKTVIDRRARTGLPSIEFFILKVTAVIEPVAAPIRITKLS